MTLIEELRLRGMIHDVIPGTEELLEKEKITGYIGFDPTATSLHIGSLVQIILLMHLQKHGHKPIALVGGATGMIGDPSGKSEERNFLDVEEIQRNVDGIKNQLSKFLNFEGDNAAELVNNVDWYGNMGFLEFLREAGKLITVNYMMAKDSVKRGWILAYRLPSLATNWCRGMIFTICIKRKTANCKWVGPTNGAIL